LNKICKKIAHIFGVRACYGAVAGFLTLFFTQFQPYAFKCQFEPYVFKRQFELFSPALKKFIGNDRNLKLMKEGVFKPASY